MDDIINNNFAEKLERLFQERTKPDGTPYTPTEILEATNGVLTRVHLWKLRNGQADNPSLKVILALADAFGISPRYFFDDEVANAKIVEADHLERLEVTLRSLGVSKTGRKIIREMIDVLRKKEEK